MGFYFLLLVCSCFGQRMNDEDCLFWHSVAARGVTRFLSQFVEVSKKKKKTKTKKTKNKKQNILSWWKYANELMALMLGV